MSRHPVQLGVELEHLRGVVTAGYTRGVETVRWFAHPVGELRSNQVINDLAEVVYSHAYVLGVARPIAAGFVEVDAEPGAPMDPPALRSLLAAREGGWELTSQQSGWSRLQKPGNPPMHVRSSLVQSDADGQNSLPVPAYSDSRLPGWLTLAHGRLADVKDITRFYFNTSRVHASATADQIALALLNAGVRAFLIKWLASAHHDSRADSMVLYVPRADAYTSQQAVDGLELALHDARVPLFTVAIGPGRSHAQDPGGPESFGQFVSRIAATHLVNELRAQPRRRGSANSRFTAATIVEPNAQQAAQPPLASAISPLEEFATQLERDAIWDEDRAGWLTRNSVDGSISSAGADVYTGAVGPVLALAHAIAATNSKAYVPLIRAAARQVLRRLTELGHGFHSGAAGTAAVLAESAVVSGDPIMRDLAVDALGRATIVAGSITRDWDVISGLAGTALGLAAASKQLVIPAPTALSDVLDRLARADRNGRGWTTAIGRGRRLLDGIAHGRWGAILALEEGSRALGEDRYADVLISAIERASSKSLQYAGRSIDRRFDGYFETASWCHGSAGVTFAALALRHRTTLCDPIIAAAVEQNVEWLEATDVPSGGLCHGAVGIALAAKAAGRRLGAPTPQAPIEEITRGNADLSLMTGASGVAVGQFVAALDLATPLALSLRTAGLREKSGANERDRRLP
jgi:hypothetical protein